MICLAVQSTHFRIYGLYLTFVAISRSHPATLLSAGDPSFGTVAGALCSDGRLSMAATVGFPSLEVIKMNSDLMYSHCFRDRTQCMPISKS